MSASARDAALGQDVPIGVVEVELAAPLPAVRGASDGRPWVAAIVVVRLHSVPLGMFVAPLRDRTSLPAGELADLVDEVLGERLRAHLEQDGLPVTGAAGVTPVAGDAPCQLRRAEVLDDAPSLSVVIPSRDRAATLPHCLDSILACTYPHDRREIVVVARYAADGHAVRYAREDAPGSASARNRGLDVVTNELVVFTDDDAIADTWWLAEVATSFRAHPEAGAVTGMLLPTALETQAQLWFEQYGGFSRGFDQRVFTVARSSDPGNLLYPYAAGVFGTGNNMAFRRSVIDEIGRFDPALGNGTPALGGVDSEVLQRTVLSGWPLVYEPRALVWHSHRREYDALRRQLYSYGAGLTAYMAKTILHNPHLLGDFLLRLPAGLRFALSPKSEKNARKTESYPADLTRAERRGMLYGLIAYPRSRRAMGRHATPRAVRPY